MKCLMRFMRSDGHNRRIRRSKSLSVQQLPDRRRVKVAQRAGENPRVGVGLIVIALPDDLLIGLIQASVEALVPVTSAAISA